MKIGILGTGLMGQPMAERLLAAGVAVVAYNRTVAKLAPLEQAGATIAAAVPALLDQCPAVITMLSDHAALQSVLLNESTRSHLRERTILQMATIGPSESQALGQMIAAAGGHYLEAPVLGSIPEAKTGKLLVMVGAPPEQFQQWLPLLQHLGPDPLYVGPVGTAAALKLALNQLIASLTTAFALSLGFVQRQGVAVDDFMQVLRQSALYAPTFDKKLHRMLAGDYAHPNFPTKHLLKDVNLFLQEANCCGLQADHLQGVQRLLAKAMAQGLAESDYSALFAAICPPATPSPDWPD